MSCGELVMLTPQLFYHKDVYEEVCALTRDFFEATPPLRWRSTGTCWEPPGNMRWPFWNFSTRPR